MHSRRYLLLTQIALEFDTDEDSPEYLSVQEEARLLEKCLYHPNIVRFYQSFRHRDHFYILMEYVTGPTLSELPQPFTHSQALTLIAQLALALKHLKNHSILHRDVKPSNILLSQKGLFKLGDFGVSRTIRHNAQANSCIGTPYYTAPEIYSNQYC